MEACDGLDSDCKGDPVWTGECDESANTLCPGREICDEGGSNAVLDTCAPAASPDCSTGTGSGSGSGVTGRQPFVCTIADSTDPDTLGRCMPAGTQIQLTHTQCGAPPCTVHVVQSAGSWPAVVARSSTDTFGPNAQTTSIGAFLLVVSAERAPRRARAPACRRAISASSICSCRRAAAAAAAAARR